MQTSVLLIVVCALVGAHGFFFVPGQPQTNLAGQCPSGIPRDGLFQNCALEHWRIGTLDPITSVVNVTFPTSFTHVPPNVDLDINADTNSKGCAIELHGAGVAFQPLANIRYAHYRLSGCAKPMGNSRCRMVVKDSFNRIVDEIETRGAQCSSDLPPHTCSECLDGFHNITIRYLGSRPTDIIVKREGDTDSSNWLTFMNVMQGDEFTIVPLDFPFSTVGSANPDVLPEVLEFVTTQDNMLTDILSLNCSLPTALPGQTFGDRAQFLMVSAVSGDGDLCPFSPAADVQCQCHVNDADEACMQSSKGFVAFPNQLYYLALVSEECGCQFDNVCLTQVSNFNGYFGVDWIYNSNLTQADFV